LLASKPGGFKFTEVLYLRYTPGTRDRSLIGLTVRRLVKPEKKGYLFKVCVYCVGCWLIFVRGLVGGKIFIHTLRVIILSLFKLSC